MRPAAVRWSVCLLLVAGQPAALQAEDLASAEPAVQRLGDNLSVSGGELEALRSQLGTANADRRATALGQLLVLGEDALLSIQARLQALTSSKLDTRALLAKIPLLRRTRALDVSASSQDQTAGLLAALEEDRSPAMQTAVELLALLRALERQHSIEAADLLVNELVALDTRLFRSELPRVRKRLGKLLVPAYLRGRAQGSPGLQKLAAEGLSTLGLSEEARFFDLSDAELVAAITRVESELGRSEALPFFVAGIDDARPSVRQASRAALEKHAEAALDLLRQRMVDVFGNEPEPGWDAPRLLRSLTEHSDALRARATVQALSQAQQALRAGDHGAVQRQLELALDNGLSTETQALAAATYFELGSQFDNANQTDRALVAYRRAVRLAPHGPEAKLAHARLLYLESEQRVASGIADLHSLARASELEPARPAAQQLHDELLGTRVAQAYDLRRQLGFVAAALLAMTALLVLRIRATNRRAARVDSLPRTTKSPSL